MNTARSKNISKRIVRLGVLACLLMGPFAAEAQDAPLVVRPEPTPRDDLEVDSDGDGIPDAWYNLRDATWEPEGGVRGPHLLRFRNDKPGRPARASRAFGVDGRKYEALIVGLWLKISDIAGGERAGEDPGFVIDFLDEGLRTVARGSIGPWTRSTIGEDRWTHVSRRLPVPAQSRDGIMTVGLIGATGVLDVDGFTLELVPLGGVTTDNLILNGGLELANPGPAYWAITGGTRLAFPGFESDSALELGRAGARAQAALAVPVRRLDALDVRLRARSSGLRGAGGATATLFFLDEYGRGLSGSAGSAFLFRFAGTTSWEAASTQVRVPAGAVRAVIQLDRTSGPGTLFVDDLIVTAAPDSTRASWTPDHAVVETEGWHPYRPAEAIAPGSALDASTLLEPSLRGAGPVTVRDAHLSFEAGGRARFFGGVLLPPLAVAEPDRADRLADALARRGVNLVCFTELDTCFGPGRSLLDDTADDSSTLDPDALARFDHTVAAFEKRGIFLALELASGRRFRSGDGVPEGASLPQGGGPATAFDSAVGDVLIRFARALLEHVNPETGRALKDDPALAWVTIACEQSLFNLLDDPRALSESWEARLRQAGESHSAGSGARLWQALEREQWTRLAKEVRAVGLKCPLAGCSHWRREAEFVGAQTAPGLDLVDDHLFWPPPRYALGDRLSVLFDPDGGLARLASQKRKSGRAYVVSQWCSQTHDLWALPFEAADLLLTTEQGREEGWDALVRRGIFFQPETWGAAPPGTTGGQDLFRIVEVANANPAVFAMLPHAASLFLKARPGDRPREKSFTWDPGIGRLTIDTPYTVALAGRSAGRPARLGTITIDSDTPTATVAVSSLGAETIGSARRLLVSAIARVEPTGHTYADPCRTAPGFPGGPPLLLEPVEARVIWKHRGTIKAYALDSAGKRIGEMKIDSLPDGQRLTLDGREPGIHWELEAVGP
jgi:hypothetical protein